MASARAAYLLGDGGGSGASDMQEDAILGVMDHYQVLVQDLQVELGASRYVHSYFPIYKHPKRSLAP